MARSAKIHAAVLAAGGIVVKQGSKPTIAVVRLRRGKSWVLPKGKLCPGESAVAAARREVLEETGCEVSVHEFLGSMSYAVRGKIKIVQFWHMRVTDGPVRELMHDVKAVKWLSLSQAIDMLTRPHEKVFLTHVGPVALRAARQSAGDRSAATSARIAGRRPRRTRTVMPSEHLPADDYGAAGRNLFVEALRRGAPRTVVAAARTVFVPCI
jgi:8-oxo-dGTP diphosphatase